MFYLSSYANFLSYICLYSVSQKNPPPRFSDIYPKRLGIFNQFFTHLLYVTIYARWQIFSQLYDTIEEFNVDSKAEYTA